MNRLDLTGRVFGRLKVISYSHVSPNFKTIWKCLCDCGKEKTILGYNLIRGATNSCGCSLLDRKTIKNPNWKGDSVEYSGLHKWVKFRLLKPKYCSNCGKEATLDLANISQEYKRDLTDWEWICRRCHMEKDGRLKNLKRTQFRKIKKSLETTS